MSAKDVVPQQDVWSEWLLHCRHAGDPAYDRVVREAIAGYARRVLDGARLAPGMTVADIGAGDGLVGFCGIDRIGPSLRLVLADISAAVLRYAEAAAVERGVRDQCTFLQCSAEKLTGIPDASIDVVTTRAVLAYVSDKRAALREFHRVLKPGGRLSIAEPIFRDDALKAIELRKMVDGQIPIPADPFRPLLPLLHRWKAAQFPDTEEQMAQNPITNYSEHELVRFVEAAGFAGVDLAFHVETVPSNITSWDVFLGFSPHPWAPALAVILAAQFTPAERQLFEQVLRPLVEARQFCTTERIAYLTAEKPRV
jgi:arsenite methyltransferase